MVHGTDMDARQKEGGGTEDEACGGEQSGELRAGLGERPGGEVGGQGPMEDKRLKDAMNLLTGD